MATEININGTLILDQNSGLQDDDTAIGNNLSGLSADFITFLNTLGLSAEQLAFADDVEAAVSDPNLVTVTQNSATITDLFFSDADGNALNGDQVFLPGGAALKTVNGDSIYLWSFGDFVIATTSNVAANQGQVVAAFYLDEAADHLSAGIEMVTFIPLAHPDGTNHDDRVDWTDVLNLTASASLSFEFDTLQSGKFLWVAVGNNENGLLVTGRDLNVQNAGTNKEGDRVSGGSDPSDAMNTSQGGAGATMGVNNQMFDPGNTAVFTLVKGFVPLDADGPDATGDNVKQIDYDSYINTSGAAMFISQTSGGGSINVTIGVFNAGGGTTPEEGFGYIGAEGGNNGTSGAFTDDTAVGVDTVQVFNGATLVGTWVDGQASDGTTQNGVKVTINGNLIDVDGIFALYTVRWTADTGQTFNRFQVTGDDGTEKFDIGRIDIDQGVTVTEPVGDQLFVDDDGPDANLATTTATVILDETDNDADDANVGPPLADVTTAISILFNDTSAFGTDGGKDADNNSAVDADAKTYSLTLNAAAGANSGLVDTLSANSIFLYKEGGAIVGRVGNNDGTADDGGAIAFTISVTNDPDNVRVIQNRALVHGDATDPDESDTPTSITADLVLLRLDVLDDDTDTDFATAELGSRIDFEDDGPSITRNATAVPTMTTDDTDISDSAGPTDFSVLFNTVFGTDGFKDANDDDVQDADAITYTLGVNAPGVDSGLVDTLTGNKIFLYLDGAVVNGRVGNNDGTANSAGTVAFSVSIVAATGAVTLTQNRAVVHNDPNDPAESGASAAFLAAADLVTVTATANDGDGDTDTASADIGLAFAFEDDGPAITAQILGGVVDFEATDSLTNSLNGDVGSDENAIDDEASDGTKTYTFDSFNIASTSIAGLTGQIVEDGTRVVFFTDGAGGTTGSYDVGVDTLWFDNVLSQDGSGDYTFTVHETPPSQFIEFDFTDLPANQSLFGLIAADKTELGEGDLGLAIIPTGATLKSDGTYVTGGGTKSNTINTSKGGGPVTIAISNQLFDKAGEGAYFAYITDPDEDAVAGVGTGLSTAYDDADNLGFGGTHELESASYEIVQNSTSSISRVTAYNIDPGRVGDPVLPSTDQNVDTTSRAFILDPDAIADPVSVTAVRVFDDAGNLLESVLNVGGVATLQDINNDGLVNGLDNNSTVAITFFTNGDGTYSADTAISKKDSDYTIEFDTSDPHDLALVSWVGGTFDIGGFNFAEGQDTPDQEFAFSVKITDYDLDTDGVGTDTFDDFSIGVDGTGAFDDGVVA